VQPGREPDGAQVAGVVRQLVDGIENFGQVPRVVVAPVRLGVALQQALAGRCSGRHICRRVQG
jgi:hypothetical protein